MVLVAFFAFKLSQSTTCYTLPLPCKPLNVSIGEKLLTLTGKGNLYCTVSRTVQSTLHFTPWQTCSFTLHPLADRFLYTSPLADPFLYTSPPCRPVPLHFTPLQTCSLHFTPWQTRSFTLHPLADLFFTLHPLADPFLYTSPPCRPVLYTSPPGRPIHSISHFAITA